jgi:subtilisin family serine protease
VLLELHIGCLLCFHHHPNCRVAPLLMLFCVLLCLFHAGTNPTCIITVANLQQTPQTLSQDSSYGAAVKVAAPGSAIFSTYIGSTTATFVDSGTSMASPHVAGMATLLFNEFTDAAATQAQVGGLVVGTYSLVNFCTVRGKVGWGATVAV